MTQDQVQQQATTGSMTFLIILGVLVVVAILVCLVWVVCRYKKNKTSWGRVDKTASSSSQQPLPQKPVIFAAVVKVKEFESKRNNPASLFGQAFFYWIGEQQQWKTTLQNMGIQKLPNDSELPANKEAELVVTYSTQWRGDLPKNSVAVQIALKKEQPSQSDIYQLPRECNIFNYGFQKG